MKRFPALCPAFALAASLLFAAGAAALSGSVYGSVAGDYSVSFPAPPEEHVHPGSGFRIVTHVVRDDNVIYIVAHGDFEVPVQADIELDANIDNYVKEFGAKVTSRGTLAFGRGDKPMPARQFIYDSDRVSGKGIVVVDGRSSYLVAATAVKPSSREPAVNAFVSSFKLIPAN
ncbi:MAG TPA: hypothetical protein VKT73_02410 [Xanthobacteraceae bacterium]|nr:hypothetical protein [Xanthobacteraceae bacterium]